ncbi:unnamed protein product [Sphenostylis stenocarpa]|uniref:Uncharacterized protein n=1 Tax=Sphenostylis stenocarpa TaxID=92480 RepID=A0AA86V869_9FABA|nr:unnamed protein product [Sphenostylis stenocarpa]
MYIFHQKTEKPETKDNVSIVAENLDKKDTIDIESKEGTDTKQLTDMKIPKSETEGVPKDESLKPKARVVIGRTEARDECSQEEIQTKADVTVKCNTEVQTPEYVNVETLEINTNNYTEEQEVPTSHAKEKEGTQDNAKCSQEEEAKGMEEPTKTLLQEEEFQARTLTPASVQRDTNQIPEQETLYIDKSELIDNPMQGCIPKMAQDTKSTDVQETDKPEPKDNVSIVTEKLDKEDASYIRSEEGTDAKQLTDVEIPKSEIEGASKDEAQQPIANTVSVGSKVVDETSQEEIQSEADIIVKSNKEGQRPEYATKGTLEINTTSYSKEQEELPISHVSLKEGIEDDGKFSQEEESKGIEEDPKAQEEELQTRSTTLAFVQGDTNQIPQQETQHIDESEVFDNAKLSCIPAIELDRKTTVVQETENPETKDNVSIVAENLDDKDETEIRAEEGTYTKQSTDVEIPKSEREVGSKALAQSSQEEILPETDVNEKSNKEMQTPEYVTDEELEINTTNYTGKQEEVPKSHPREKERIEDKFNQAEEVKGISEAAETPEEEVQTRSSTPASVQGDTNQILQKKTLQADESEVIDNATIVQETEVSETKDNAERAIENLGNDTSEIREGKDVNQLNNLEMPKSETEGN